MPIRPDRAPAPGTTALMEALHGSLSTPRLNSYLMAANQNAEKAVALYLWNTSMGQSLHYPLEIAEVAFRNSILRALTAEYTADWIVNPACLDILGEPRLREINKAKERARKIWPEEEEPTVDQVVSCSMFGFWVALL